MIPAVQCAPAEWASVQCSDNTEVERRETAVQASACRRGKKLLHATLAAGVQLTLKSLQMLLYRRVNVYCTTTARKRQNCELPVLLTLVRKGGKTNDACIRMSSKRGHERGMFQRCILVT